jgi:hypothetical protein
VRLKHYRFFFDFFFRIRAGEAVDGNVTGEETGSSRKRWREEDGRDIVDTVAPPPPLQSVTPPAGSDGERKIGSAV